MPEKSYSDPHYAMCNHFYTADYAKMPRTMGKRCPYPDFYKKAQLTALSAPEADPARSLPVDDSGACIFHSQAVAWKRNNNFNGHFLQLVQLLNADKAVKWYDFAEFVFVGSELTTTHGVAEHALHIADTIFLKQAYFTGASFLDSVALERVDFKDGADFRVATFAHDLRIANARFHGLDFSNATARQLAFFTKVEFLSFTLFEKTQFTGATDGYVVKFEDSHFEGITDFSRAAFALGDESSVGFLNVQFQDVTDFGSARFHGQVVFSDVLRTQHY
jgi:uncharacterized protein YjbI with pentapeptide repeats